MQTQGGVDADAAILSPDKTIRAEIKVDWFKNGGYAHFLTDLSPYADNITVDRSLAGAAPSEVMLIEGAAAAELTFEVGGSLTPGVYGALTLTDPMDFVSVLSPYNGASPMYNVDMATSELLPLLVALTRLQSRLWTGWKSFASLLPIRIGVYSTYRLTRVEFKGS
jgi:hypothetical protein